MANPIRLDIEVLAGQASISGVEQLASRIASDVNQSVDRVIQSAVSQTDRVVAKINEIGNSITKISNAATIGFREAFAAPTQQLTQMLSLLERIEQVTSRVRSVGSGGSSAGGGGSAGTVNNLRAELARLEAAGFDFSGRSTKVYTPTSTTTATELLNEQGRRLTATYNTQGNLSRLSLGLQPKPEPTQAEVYAKQMADQQIINTRLTAFDTAKRLADDQKAKDAAAESAAQQARIAESVTRGRDFFSAKGYSQVGQRVVGGANGEETTLIMRNQEGAIGRLELATGRYTANLETAKSRWSGIASALGENISGVKNLGIATAAWFYSISSIASTIKGMTFDPLVSGLQKVVDATEQSRKFEYSVSGPLGGLANAREFNQLLIRDSFNSPLSVSQAQEAARQELLTPGLSARVGGLSPQAGAASAINFGNLIGRLSQIEPDEGTEGALRSVRNSLQGNFSSIQRRIGLSANTLAGLAGVSRSDLTQTPSLALKGIEKYADIFIPESAYSQTAQLVSIRFQKLQDAVQNALRKIGDSGIYDYIGKGLNSITQQLNKYFEGSDFEKNAQVISDSLVHILGNLGRTVDSIVSSVTGNAEDSSTVGGAVTTVADLIAKMSSLSDNLPSAVKGIVPAITTFVTTIGNFVDAVTSLAGVINNPQAAAQGFVDRQRSNYAAATDSAEGVTQNDRLLAILKANGVPTDLVGRQTYEAKTTADDTYNDIRKQSPGGIVGGSLNFLHASGAMYLDDFKDTWGTDISTNQQLDFRRLPPDQLARALRIQRQFLSGQPINGQSMVDAAAKPRGDESEISKIFSQYGQMYQTPDYATYGTAITNSLKSITDLVNKGESPLERLSSNTNGIINDVYTDADGKHYNLGEFREMITRRYDTSNQGYSSALSKARNAPNPNQTDISIIDSSKKENTSRYNALFTVMENNKIEEVKQFAEALFENIKDVPASARVEILKQITNGTYALANQLAKAIGEPADGRFKTYGLASLPVADQLKLSEATQASGLENIANRQKFGDIGAAGPNASPMDLMNLQLATPRETATSQISFLQSRIGEQSVVLQDAKSAYADAQKSGGDTTLATSNLVKAQTDIAETSAQLKGLNRSIDDTGLAWEEFGTSARGALESNLGSAINNLIKGTGSLKDALLGFVNDITQAFSQMAAKDIITSVIGQAGVPGQGTNGQPGPISGVLGNATSWLGGLFKGGVSSSVAGPAGGVGDFYASAPTQLGFNPSDLGFVGAANGGIFPGSFIPFKSYSGGGIATRPTFGLIAEAGMNEAMVPLPNGSHIPVEFKNGGAQRQGDTYIVNSVDEAVNRGFVRHRDTMINTVTNEVMRGGTRTNRAVRRA